MNGRKLATSNKQLTGELATLIERKVPASNTLKKQTAPDLRTHQYTNKHITQELNLFRQS